MGKYDTIRSVLENRFGENKDSLSLQRIANELAEMNRLKRLELNEKYGKSDWAKDMQSDQA